MTRELQKAWKKSAVERSGFIMDGDEFYAEFLRLAHQGTEVRIATFGLYAGKDDDHTVARLLHNLPPAKIIVGKPYFMSCQPNCADCLDRYKERMKFIEKTTRRFKAHNWLIRDKVHFKVYLVLINKRWQGWAGSRNLTGSGWGDVMVRLHSYDACGLAFEFNKFWKRSE